VTVRSLLGATLALLVALTGCGAPRRDRIVVGCKNFTEQVVLGELLAQHIENRTGMRVERRFYLAGSYISHQALLSGRIDLYVEYTGTALTAVLKLPPGGGREEVFRRVKAGYAERWNLAVTDPLGFNNTFAMVVRGEEARARRVRTLSQAAQHAPAWRAGVGYEFLERPDGFPGLVKTYGLIFREPPRTMDLGLLYRALKEKQIDLAAGNSTDGLIAALDLAVLEDDRGYFPPYEAVPIVRADTLERHPAVRRALAELAGKITEAEMQRLNYALDGEKRDVQEVVRQFLVHKGLAPSAR